VRQAMRMIQPRLLPGFGAERSMAAATSAGMPSLVPAPAPADLSYMSAAAQPPNKTATPSQATLLRQTLHQFGSLVQVITDGAPPYRILSISTGWEKLTGYHRNEVVGATLKILQGPATEPEQLQTLMRAVHMEMPAAVQLTNYTKFGEPFVQQLFVEPLRDPSGLTRSYQATSLILQAPGEVTPKPEPQTDAQTNVASHREEMIGGLPQMCTNALPPLWPLLSRALPPDELLRSLGGGGGMGAGMMGMGGGMMGGGGMGAGMMGMGGGMMGGGGMGGGGMGGGGMGGGLERQHPQIPTPLPPNVHPSSLLPFMPGMSHASSRSEVRHSMGNEWHGMGRPQGARPSAHAAAGHAAGMNEASKQANEASMNMRMADLDDHFLQWLQTDNGERTTEEGQPVADSGVDGDDADMVAHLMHRFDDFANGA